MIVDLKRFFLHDTPWETMELDLDFSEVEELGRPIFLPGARAQVELKGLAGSVSVKAHVAYTLEKPCDRCGALTRKTYTGTFTHILVREFSGGEPDGGEYVLVPDCKVDLAGLLREDVLLDLPWKFLCREDCKGLCPRCGKNLNEGPCTCSPEVDPRMEALRELL